MKNLILLLFIVTINILGLAQDLPMKNGLMYYKFENKLENKKKCLRTYLLGLDGNIAFGAKFVNNIKASNTKDLSLSKQFLAHNIIGSAQNVERHMTVMYPINYTQRNNKICSDTLVDGLFILGLPSRSAKIYEYIGAYQIATVFKDKPFMQMITGNIEMVFIDKTQYILKIKGLVLKTTFRSGKVENLPLGKIYEAFQKDEKKAKDMINMFNYIDASIKDVNIVLKESFIETYNIDETD